MSLHEQLYVIEHDFERHDAPAVLAGFRADQFPAPGSHPDRDDGVAVLPAPPHVITQVIHPAHRNPHFPGHVGDYTHGLCQTTRFPCRLKTAIPTRGA